ncbi:GNAT family N-acetyltransferase [Patescibacteria group bacterium]
MVKIIKVDREKAMDFNETEWQEANKRHFGPGIKWNTTPFAFKAVENSKVIGLIFGKHESGTIYVSNIIVTKGKRRQGIGTMLIKRAEDFGKDFGDHKIWLISGKHYEENLFFEKLGFKKRALLPNLFFHKDFAVYSKGIE